jgi:hypothetical protein
VRGDGERDGFRPAALAEPEFETLAAAADLSRGCLRIGAS